MPTLNQLTCHVERSPSDTPLREYQTMYGDGVVSTYIGIPSNPTAFSVHLTSNGFIASGLSMFVFIDGVFQCNRNRCDLSPPGNAQQARLTDINFRVRQKEENRGDGNFIAHDWKFEKLNVAAADKMSTQNEPARNSVGCIEVLILRCFESPPPICPTHAMSFLTYEKTTESDANNRIQSRARQVTSDIETPADDLGGPFDGSNDGGPFLLQRSFRWGLDGSDDWPQMPGSWDEVQDDTANVVPREATHDAWKDTTAAPDLVEKITNWADSTELHEQASSDHQSDAQVTTTQRVEEEDAGMNNGLVPSPLVEMVGQGTYEPNSAWPTTMNDQNQSASYTTASPTDSKQSGEGDSTDSASQRSNKQNEQNNSWDATNKHNGGESSNDAAWNNNTDNSATQADDWSKPQPQSAGGWPDTTPKSEKPASTETRNESDTQKRHSGNPPSHFKKHSGGRSVRSTRSKSSQDSGTRSRTDFDPSKPYVKGYWSNWHSDFKSTPSGSDEGPAGQTKSAAKQASASRAQVYPPPTSAPASASVVAAEKLSHQVGAGKGAAYYHSINRPKYIDKMDKPFAVFVFKYRSNDMLEEILGEDLKEWEYDRGSFRDRMMKCKKEDVVEELMRMKSALGYESDCSVDSGFEANNDGASGVSAIRSSRSRKSGESSPEKAPSNDEISPQGMDSAKVTEGNGW